MYYVIIIQNMTRVSICAMDMPRMYSSIMRDKKIIENAFCNENYRKMI